ncbi:MAG: PIG-L family deacetylase, partial [Dehalococcoidia bacterium]
METKPAQVMVVTPHPDDAEFGVAGTVVRWIKEGKDVVYVVCANGDKGTDDRNMKPGKLARIREQEQLAAAELLGVREVVFLRHPDQGL